MRLGRGGLCSDGVPELRVRHTAGRRSPRAHRHYRGRLRHMVFEMPGGLAVECLEPHSGDKVDAIGHSLRQLALALGRLRRQAGQAPS